MVYLCMNAVSAVRSQQITWYFKLIFSLLSINIQLLLRVNSAELAIIIGLPFQSPVQLVITPIEG